MTNLTYATNTIGIEVLSPLSLVEDLMVMSLEVDCKKGKGTATAAECNKGYVTI